MGASRFGDEVAYEACEGQVTEDSEELALEVAEVLLESEVCKLAQVVSMNGYISITRGRNISHPRRDVFSPGRCQAHDASCWGVFPLCRAALNLSVCFFTHPILRVFMNASTI